MSPDKGSRRDLAPLAHRTVGQHNRGVHRPGRAWITAVVLFVGSSVAANAFGDLLAAATALACCQKTDYECAGVSTPDDCCQHMGHAAISSVANIVAKAQPPGLAMIGVIPALAAQIASAPFETHADLAFKRPHDPPHLHPFSLLI